MRLLTEYSNILEKISRHKLDIVDNQLIIILKLNNITHKYDDQDKNIKLLLKNIKYELSIGMFGLYLTRDVNIQCLGIVNICSYLNIKIPDELLEKFIYELT